VILSKDGLDKIFIPPFYCEEGTYSVDSLEAVQDGTNYSQNSHIRKMMEKSISPYLRKNLRLVDGIFSYNKATDKQNVKKSNESRSYLDGGLNMMPMHQAV